MQTRVAAGNIYDTTIIGIEALIIPVLRYCKNILYPGKRDTGTAIPTTNPTQTEPTNRSLSSIKYETDMNYVFQLSECMGHYQLT